MKKIYSVFPLLFLSVIVSAQTLCESFDNCGTLTGTQDREHTFDLFGNGNTGCLSNWEVVSGTPSVYNTFVTPYNGTDYALFGVHNSTTTESAAVKYDFMAGNTYTVTLAVSNNNSSVPLAIDFVLLDAPINYTYNYSVGSSALPAIPSSAVITNSVSNFTSTPWQVISFTVSNLTQNFSRLWIRQTAAANTYLFVDSLCISRVLNNTYCQSFDSCGSLTGPQDREHTFDVFGNGHSGCLEDWEVTNGTPSVYNSFVAPYSGTDYALFGIHNSSTTESAALKYNFLAGHSYTVTMALSNYHNNDPITIDYYLLNAPISYTYNYSVGSSAIRTVPASAVLTHSETNFTSTAWQVVTFDVSNLSADFSRLWIRQYSSASNYLFVDDLCITENETVGIKDITPTEAVAYLGQNFPNPFSDGSTISYSLPEANSKAEIKLFDVAGKLIKTYQVSGNHGTLMLNKEELQPGIYFYSLITPHGVADTKRMIVQ